MEVSSMMTNGFTTCKNTDENENYEDYAIPSSSASSSLQVKSTIENNNNNNRNKYGNNYVKLKSIPSDNNPSNSSTNTNTDLTRLHQLTNINSNVSYLIGTKKLSLRWTPSLPVIKLTLTAIYCWLLLCTLFINEIYAASSSSSSPRLKRNSNPHVFSNQFALHIPAGDNKANEVASKYGYKNLGQVSNPFFLVYVISKPKNYDYDLCSVNAFIYIIFMAS